MPVRIVLISGIIRNCARCRYNVTGSAQITCHRRLGVYPLLTIIHQDDNAAADEPCVVEIRTNITVTRFLSNCLKCFGMKCCGSSVEKLVHIQSLFVKSQLSERQEIITFL